LVAELPRPPDEDHMQRCVRHVALRSDLSAAISVVSPFICDAASKTEGGDEE